MKILHLISSARGNASFSKKLGDAIVEKLQLVNDGNTLVNTRDLTATPFPHLEGMLINSFFTPEESRPPEMIEALRHSDHAIAELMESDVIVIDVPMHNFSIPSTLKTWIDHVSRNGKTFRYTETGAKGLVTDKKVYLAIASGGVYSEGPMKSYDFTETYLRTVLGFMGMTNVTTIRVEGIAITQVREKALAKAIQSIQTSSQLLE